MAPDDCSLDEAALGQQLDRYRAAGAGAQLIAAGPLTRVIRVNDDVPDALIDELIVVEERCCPFFELEYDRATRRFTIAVADPSRATALEPIAQALGVR